MREGAMTRKELLEAVMSALRETQQLSGHADDIAISEATVPFSDLIDFDSLNAVEATVALEQRLGRTLQENVFVDGKGRPLSVRGVAERLLESTSPTRV
jgi:acyl carrier protein